MKRLVVDTIPLLSKPTGVGRYTFEIASRLQGFDLWYYYGYLSKELRTKPLVGKRVLDRLPLLKRGIRKVLEVAGRKKRFDIYFEPNFIPKKLNAKVVVTTIHDLSFMRYPQWHPKERIEYFQNHFFEGLGRSDRFITVSHFIKGEMVKYLGIDERRIEVIYNGIDHTLFRQYDNEVLEHFSAIHDLPKSFILFVGSIEPRKNLSNLLKAYYLLPKEYKKRYPLLLAGFSGWSNEEIVKLMESDRAFIKYLGYVSDEELAMLYNLADIFVYPSFYEGFGIPPIEAMACGCSVLVSDRASLPEVCGDGALYCEPEVEDIESKLKRLIEDENLRKELSEKGLSVAEKYTWQKSAKQHEALFKKLI